MYVSVRVTSYELRVTHTLSVSDAFSLIGVPLGLCVLQMVHGISGHYNYNKMLRYWGVINGIEKGYTESEIPEKRKSNDLIDTP